MRDTHFLSGLKQLRGETMGRIADLDRQLMVLERQWEEEVIALAEVDAVLRRQAPDFPLESIKARRAKGSRISTRGDGGRAPVTRAIMKLLRLRNVPMTVQEIVECLQQDYPAADPKKLTANTRALLSAKKGKGVLRTTPTGGRALAYSFANCLIAEQPRLAA